MSFQLNIQDLTINEKLKKMWAINNILATKGVIEFEEDRKFWNENIGLIKDYYFANSQYWATLPDSI